jgi:hypothetical protein
MLCIPESITKAPGAGIAYTAAWDAVWDSTNVVLFRHVSDTIQFGVAGSTIVSLHYDLIRLITRKRRQVLSQAYHAICNLLDELTHT